MLFCTHSKVAPFSVRRAGIMVAGRRACYVARKKHTFYPYFVWLCKMSYTYRQCSKKWLQVYGPCYYQSSVVSDMWVCFFLYVWAQMCWCECDGQVLNLVLISCFLPVFKFMLCNCSIWAVWKSVECSHYFTVIHKCFWIFGLLFDVVTDKFLRNGMLFIVKNMKTVMYVSPTIWVLKS